MKRKQWKFDLCHASLSNFSLVENEKLWKWKENFKTCYTLLEWRKGGGDGAEFPHKNIDKEWVKEMVEI